MLSRRFRPRLFLVAIATLAVLASGRDSRAADVFVDVTKERGIRFSNVNGARGKKHLVETMLAGAAWVDYDRDGFLDLYLVQGHAHLEDALDAPQGSGRPGNVLYRSLAARRFKDVSSEARVDDRGYGMGVAVGDYDGDGYPDLYVTNYGRNTLYHNEGDGTFREVTEAAGVGAPASGGPVWSTSATWADFDGDGNLDLFVLNYLAYDTRRHAACDTPIPGTGRTTPAYCHPNRFAGVADTLYRNLGDGKFLDVSTASGIARVGGYSEAKGLGVVASDFDGDGDADLLVANDSVSNTLWRNLGSFRFEEVGLESGFALNGEGSPEAGMGITRGDVNGDGLLDYFVTNFSRETNTLYLNQKGFFLDATVECGLARGGYLSLGFGTRFLDVDLDGDLDLYVANGHILDNAELLHPGEGVSYAQRDALFENDGRGRFRDISRSAGEWFERALVGRTVIEGDYDNDGDGDLVVTHVAGPAVLLENRQAGKKNWIGLDPGARPRSHGARVELEAAGRTIVHEMQRDGGYLGAHDARLRFGLDSDVDAVRVRVRWPGEKGPPETFASLTVGRYHTLDGDAAGERPAVEPEARSDRRSTEP